MARLPLPVSQAVIRAALLGALAFATAGCSMSGPARPGERIHRNVAYAERDGKKLHLDIYVPDAPRRIPVILWFHGGGWNYGNKGYSLRVRGLTRDGFAIVAVQYRLLREGRWPAQIDDCRDALQWVRENGSRYGLDPSRIALAGESAGGHLATLLGVRENRPRVKAVLALYPPTDLVAMGRRYSHYRRLSVFTRMFGGDIEDRRTAAHVASPVAHVTPRAPAMRLLHGSLDQLVPLNQSERLAAILNENGVPVELVVVEGRGHGFPLDDVQLRQAGAFFRRHLR
jgi:acetyl esterase/lipase